MHCEEVMVDDMIQLNVEGRIDSNSSSEFQMKVLQAYTKSNSLIINMENVTYLSSAGLRVFLMGARTASSKGGKQIIINATPTVRDVFRISGVEGNLDIR